MTRTASAADFGIPASAPGGERLTDAGLVRGPGQHQDTPSGRAESLDQRGAVDEGAVGLGAEVEVEQDDPRREFRGGGEDPLAAAGGVPPGLQARHP